MLLLDIGGVLTNMGGGKRYGYDALTPGALAYLSLHLHRWGPSSLCVVSRTNHGNSKRTSCWGWRVLEDIVFLTFSVFHLQASSSVLGQWTRVVGQTSSRLHMLWMITHSVLIRVSTSRGRSVSCLELANHPRSRAPPASGSWWFTWAFLRRSTVLQCSW